MRYDGIHIKGLGTALPQICSADSAVTAGSYSPEEHAKNGILGVPVAPEDETPPEMATTAARKALAEAGTPAADVDLVIYGCQWDPQHTTPASYLHRHLGIRATALNMEVRQGCSGGITMLDVAARYLHGSTDTHTALVATADRFCLPGWDRYRSEEGYIWGDAASAVVLSDDDGGGFARLLATSFSALPAMEEVARGSLLAGATRGELPLKLRKRKQALYKKIGPLAFRTQFQNAVRDTARDALRQAGVAHEEIRWFLVPNMGLQWRTWALCEPLGIDDSRTTWTDHGRHIGHTGLADQALALEFLVGSGRVASGDRLLLLAVGVGLTFAAAVVEIA
ncbi:MULTISPECIES: ketoacyl-ACP synthase III family protein [Streptomyces]|uniref:Ketoacyl-ACP synthase III family protein n=1 Tax=Streptomyces morookaense TaxID=1970 RepID=A0A7Y7E4Z5_STRMO|nr:MULTISPECIES: ketoacyl-ACP synthase III family protein [Streptomyces]MCC2276968.1 ketoacyl-ACP synthase III family protein [Streptomyces sp. ET3-23]NVK76095.1 ketoacyl-ACP synthase III family protein [Streptomyces morookaense]GHF37328.1 3-oxoacyl-[acyl-carrier-protein] synthase 3 [Streptomyces morookaense]